MSFWLTDQKKRKILNVNIDYTIRKARLKDKKAIQDLNYQLFLSDLPHDPFLNANWPYSEGDTYFSKAIKGEDAFCFVAEYKNEIVGYLAGFILKKKEDWRPVKRAELENMIVRQDFRGKGIGEKLVQEFLSWCKDKKVKKVVVSAYANNQKGIRFYEKCGFYAYSMTLEADIF